MLGNASFDTKLFIATNVDGQPLVAPGHETQGKDSVHNAATQQIFDAMEAKAGNLGLEACSCPEHRWSLIKITDSCFIYTAFELTTNRLQTRTSCPQCRQLSGSLLYRHAKLHPALFDDNTHKYDIRRLSQQHPNGVSSLILPLRGAVDAANNALKILKSITCLSEGGGKRENGTEGKREEPADEKKEETVTDGANGDSEKRNQRRATKKKQTAEKVEERRSTRSKQKGGILSNTPPDCRFFYLPLVEYNFTLKQPPNAYDVHAKTQAYDALKYVQSALPSSSEFAHSVSTFILSARFPVIAASYGWEVQGWELGIQGLQVNVRQHPLLTETYPEQAPLSSLVSKAVPFMLKKAVLMCEHIHALGAKFTHSPLLRLFSYESVCHALAGIPNAPPLPPSDKIELRSSMRSTIFYDKHAARYIKVSFEPYMTEQYVEENNAEYEQLREELDKLRVKGMRVPYLPERFLVSPHRFKPAEVSDHLAIEITEDCGSAGVKPFLKSHWHLCWNMVDCALSLCMAHREDLHLGHGDLRGANIAMQHADFEAGKDLLNAQVSFLDWEFMNYGGVRYEDAKNTEENRFVELHAEQCYCQRITMATSLWQTAVMLLTILYDHIEGKRVPFLDAILPTFPTRPQHESWTEGVRLLMRRAAITLLCLSYVPQRQQRLELVEALSKQVNDIIAHNTTITKANLAQLLPVSECATIKQCDYFQYMEYQEEAKSAKKAKNNSRKRADSPVPHQGRAKKTRPHKAH